jgi:uncharacterized protein (DUF1330 family)
MPAGYVIAQITVTDPEAYKDYVAAVSPIVETYGGEYLVRGGPAQYFEAEPIGERTVVIRFPSVQAATEWYHSEEYAPVRAMRQAASKSLQTIIEGA